MTASWPRLLPVDDICAVPTPWNCWYGELGLSSAPETLQFQLQSFGTVYQQLWDCLTAQFRHLQRSWKLSMPARRWSASENHLFCALKIRSLLLLLLLLWHAWYVHTAHCFYMRQNLCASSRICRSHIVFFCSEHSQTELAACIMNQALILLGLALCIFSLHGAIYTRCSRKTHKVFVPFAIESHCLHQNTQQRFFCTNQYKTCVNWLNILC